jgi:SAM-dependent methyltransferase
MKPQSTPHDYRDSSVDYYDRFASPPEGDVEFYRSRIGGAVRVLELGCGTGRVMLQLAECRLHPWIGSFPYRRGLEGTEVRRVGSGMRMLRFFLLPSAFLRALSLLCGKASGGPLFL